MRKLRKGESIVTAFAEGASGPGWSNALVWVIIRRVDGALEQECLQPDEQTAEMSALYAVSAAAHGSMTRACRKKLVRRK